MLNYRYVTIAFNGKMSKRIFWFEIMKKISNLYYTVMGFTPV